ncbi:hypothetical protein OG948_60195 (plasmid) [Embleya sp. NBC_00888]|uniref:hypothetical protein n=1 Tax=Embleya sp. NBC_00888 TaxID=2975960 RepID=UPI002F9099CB|nr:hypothetical protein OG948_60195 [Embleya sp. NBC_00888]
MHPTPTVIVEHARHPDDLYLLPDGRTEPQPAAVELNVTTGRLTALPLPYLESAREPLVAMGVARRHRIPLLGGDPANELLDLLVGAAQRVIDGASWLWNPDAGHLQVALDARATRAEAEMRASCTRWDTPGPIRDARVLRVLTAHGWARDTGRTLASLAHEHDIAADSDLQHLAAVTEIETARARAALGVPHARDHPRPAAAPARSPPHDPRTDAGAVGDDQARVGRLSRACCSSRSPPCRVRSIHGT